MLKQITLFSAKYIFPVAAKLAQATTINCGIGWIYATQIERWESTNFYPFFPSYYSNPL